MLGGRTSQAPPGSTRPPSIAPSKPWMKPQSSGKGISRRHEGSGRTQRFCANILRDLRGSSCLRDEGFRQEAFLSPPVLHAFVIEVRRRHRGASHYVMRRPPQMDGCDYDLL